MSTVPRRIAIGYDRVSTKRQAKNGIMLEARSVLIPRFCKMKGWKLLSYHTDPGISGREGKHRPGLEAAMDEACQPGRVLVVDSIPRFVRSNIDADRLLKRLQTAGADICIVGMGLDASTAGGKFIYQVMSAAAELESNVIGERVKASNDYTVATKGYRTQGEQKFGWMLDENKDRVKCPEEQDLLVLVRAAYRFTETWYGAAKRLNNSNVPTAATVRAQRRNRPTNPNAKWNAMLVKQLLT